MSQHRAFFCTAIIGPESVGKTTLAHDLAQRHNGIYIEEYARTYVEALQRPYTYEDVEQIAHYQIEQLEHIFADNASEEKQKLYFFDTDLIITRVWFLRKYGHCPDFVNHAIRQYPMDVYLLCYPDLPWIADPTRENPTIREELFAQYEQEIQTLDIPYYIVRHNNNL